MNLEKKEEDTGHPWPYDRVTLSKLNKLIKEKKWNLAIKFIEYFHENHSKGPYYFAYSAFLLYQQSTEHYEKADKYYQEAIKLSNENDGKIIGSYLNFLINRTGELQYIKKYLICKFN